MFEHKFKPDAALQSLDSVVLIGPAKSGKSTVGRLLAAKLDIPLQVYDIITMAREHAQYDQKHADQLSSEGGVTVWYRYLLPLGVEVLLQRLEKTERAVIEIARWYADPGDTELFKSIRKALAHYKHVIMLRPSDSVDQSYRVLEKRWMVFIDDVDMNAYFLRNPSNYELAKHVVYTKGRTSTETFDEIMSLLDPKSSPIVFIGPMRAGKSTQSHLVAQALGRERVVMDDECLKYYKEIGWSSEIQHQIGKTDGLSGVYHYWKQFDIHAVERVLTERADCVIDFGAGHSVFEDESLLAKARAAFAPIQNVFFLLPSENLEESFQILWDRDVIKVDGIDGNRYFLGSPEVTQLATRTILTEGKEPEQTCEEILAAIAPAVISS